MKHVYKTLLFLSPIIVTNKLFGQQIQVRSQQTNESTIGAHLIIVDPTTNQTTTAIVDATESIQLPNQFKSAKKLRIKIHHLGHELITDTLIAPFQAQYTYLLQKERQTINEVVITGQYSAMSEEKSVNAVRVISGKKIALMGAQNLRDVLSNELNIRLSQDNILGANMQMQGLNGQKIKILMDGVPVIGRLDGNIDLSQINMNNVERIEIIEGPLSVNYGTDALAGTINIITNNIPKDQWTIQTNHYYESIGTYNNFIKGSYHVKRHHFQANVGRNYFDGWSADDRAFEYVSKIYGDSSRVNSWKPKEQYFGQFQYGYRYGNTKLTVSTELFDELIKNYGYPRAPYGATSYDDRYKTIRSTNNINLQTKLSSQFSLNVLAAYNYYKRRKNTYLKDLTTLNEQLTADASDQDTTTFQNYMSRTNLYYLPKNEHFKAELGYDINHEISTGTKITNNKQSIGDYALFATAEYIPIQALTFKPGLRVAHNTDYKAPLIPSLNIRYQITDAKNMNDFIVLRTSYAKGFRAPSLKEIYFDFVDINHNIVGNPNLKAEYSHNFTLNVSAQKMINNQILRINLNNYYNKIDDLIQMVLSDENANAYTYANVGNYQTFGSTLTFDWAIRHLKLNLGGGYMALFNDESKQHQEADKFSITPEIKANIIYEVKPWDLSIALFYKYTGVRPGFNIDNNQQLYKTSIEDYHMADMTLAKKITPWMQLGVGCKNLFNVTTIQNNSVSASAHSTNSNTSALATGRNYFLKLNLSFKG